MHLISCTLLVLILFINLRAYLCPFHMTVNIHTLTSCYHRLSFQISNSIFSISFLYLTSICSSPSLSWPVSQRQIWWLYLYDRDLLHYITVFEPGCTLTSAAALSLHQPVQTYRYTLLPCTIVIQMLGWWLKCLSLLIGVCKGITAEGEPCHTSFDMEKSHLWAPKQHYLQRTEYSR